MRYFVCNTENEKFDKIIKYKDIEFKCITKDKFESDDDLNSIGYIRPIKEKDLTTNNDQNDNGCENNLKILKVEKDSVEKTFKITNKKPKLLNKVYYTELIDEERNKKCYAAICKFNFLLNI